MLVSDPDALAAQWSEWRSGIAYEIAYWSRWLALKGGANYEDFANRTNPDLPVDHYFEAVVQRYARGRIAVLDVGAGPLCCLGKTSRHAELAITALDPLADEYDHLLAQHGVVPIVRTSFGLSEDLTLQYLPGSFDIVHCQNALDHSLDPTRALLQMLDVCRIGGFVMLRHAHNEAEHESYQGFHKWNLTDQNGAFILWNKQSHHDLTHYLRRFSTHEFLLRDGYLINVFRKTGEVATDYMQADRLRQHNFQRAVLRSLAHV